MGTSKISIVRATYFAYRSCRCRHNHDIAAYLAAKPADLVFPQAEDVNNIPVPVEGSIDVEKIADSKIICPVFSESGECR